MENASKALIIAGSILLSVLIVSLGIMVFQNAKNTAGSSNLSKQEIETFNSQWQSYEGTNKTASEVKSMIQAVIASNAAETQHGTDKWIGVVNDGDPSTAPQTAQPKITVPATITNSKTYTISCGYDNASGLIVSIGYK